MLDKLDQYQMLLVGAEGTNRPIFLRWSRPVAPATDRGAIAAGGVVRPAVPRSAGGYGERKLPDTAPPNNPTAQPKSVSWRIPFPPLTEE
jgi:hypothetical protein